MTERTAFLDFLINTLMEHEKTLSELTDRIEKIIGTLENVNTNKFTTYRASEVGTLLAQAVMFIIDKGLDEEFKAYLREWNTCGQRPKT